MFLLLHSLYCLIIEKQISQDFPPCVCATRRQKPGFTISSRHAASNRARRLHPGWRSSFFFKPLNSAAQFLHKHASAKVSPNSPCSHFTTKSAEGNCPAGVTADPGRVGQTRVQPQSQHMHTQNTGKQLHTHTHTHSERKQRTLSFILPSL